MCMKKRPIRYLSFFSGIEGATVAWKPLGWEAVAFSEIEPFPCAVLKHHYPDVPNLGDITKITDDQIKALGHIDVVIGGAPCQDLSVAGKRAGLRNEDGSATRSGLFFDQMRLFEVARKYCGARFLIYENVPGLFSSNKGYDFAFVLGSMVEGDVPVPRDGWKNSGVCISESGHRCVEWRTLDSQHFGVAQRRRRVISILDTGAWWSRPPILFEFESLSGNPPKGKGARKETSGTPGEDLGENGCLGWNARDIRGGKPFLTPTSAVVRAV